MLNGTIGQAAIAVTSGTYTTYSNPHYEQLAQIQNYLSQAQERKLVADGTKPIVICRGVVTETKDMDEAQRIAESEAHSKSADAYILKPVKRIAPKREVVTVDL